MDALRFATTMNEHRQEDDFGDKIRAARAYARVDQEEAAKVIGVSSGTISAWERGKTRVPTVARAGVIEGLVKLTGWRRSFFTEGVDE